MLSSQHRSKYILLFLLNKYYVGVRSPKHQHYPSATKASRQAIMK